MSASGGVGATSRLRASPVLPLLAVPNSNSIVESGVFTGLLPTDSVAASTALPDGVGISECWRSGVNAVSARYFNVEAAPVNVPQQLREFGAIRFSSGRSNGVGPLMGLRYSRTTAAVNPINPTVTATFNLSCPGVVPTDCVLASARNALGSNIVRLGAYCDVAGNVVLKVANFGTLQSVVDANTWEIAVVREGATGGVGPISERYLAVTLPGVTVNLDATQTQTAAFPGVRAGDMIMASPDDSISLSGNVMVCNVRVSANDQVEWTYGNLDPVANHNTQARNWVVAALPQITVR